MTGLFSIKILSLNLVLFPIFHSTDKFTGALFISILIKIAVAMMYYNTSHLDLCYCNFGLKTRDEPFFNQKRMEISRFVTIGSVVIGDGPGSRRLLVQTQL